MLTADEQFSIGLIHPRGHVGEIDAAQRFLDMEFARLSVDAGTIPVVDAVGGVGVLLDLVNEEARADGMEATARDGEVLAF